MVSGTLGLMVLGTLGLMVLGTLGLMVLGHWGFRVLGLRVEACAFGPCEPNRTECTQRLQYPLIKEYTP